MSKIFRPRFARYYTRNSRFPLKSHFFTVKTPYFFAALRADFLISRGVTISVHFPEILKSWGVNVLFLDKIPSREFGVTIRGGVTIRNPLVLLRKIQQN